MHQMLFRRTFFLTALILVLCVVGTTLEGAMAPGCPTGFFGINCSLMCRYPGYGENCQRSCNCSEDYCNFATGCEKRKVRPQDSNVSTESTFWMSTYKTSQTPKTNEGFPTTPILIGAIVVLSLILAAITARFLCKKIADAHLLMDRRETEMRTTEMVAEIDEVDDMADHLYEVLDEHELEKCNMMEKKTASENDYIDSLAFAKSKTNSDERESKHFYDALK